MYEQTRLSSTRANVSQSSIKSHLCTYSMQILIMKIVVKCSKKRVSKLNQIGLIQTRKLLIASAKLQMTWSFFTSVPPLAIGTRTELWFGHGCFGQRTLLERERSYGLGMDALVSVCFSNTNEIMVWAWMLWSAYALGTRTELWFGHECSVSVCSWNTNGIMVWARMLWSAYDFGTRTELWFGHGCSGQSMLLEHERNCDLGMDALVNICSWNTNRTVIWAWMFWCAYALGCWCWFLDLLRACERPS